MTNTDRYTDHALEVLATATHAMPGDIRRFEILTQVPLEVRQKIDQEAWTMSNYQGGRYSDCMRRAVDTWKRTGTFPFQDRAKAHRDAENAANKGNLGPRIILPMN